MIGCEEMKYLMDLWRSEQDRKARDGALYKMNELSRIESAWFESASYQIEQRRIKASVDETIAALDAAFLKEETEDHD